MLRLHCDNPTCDANTDPDHPVGWITVNVDQPRRLGERSTRHYHSIQCEYDHVYILTHGDAGK